MNTKQGCGGVYLDCVRHLGFNFKTQKAKNTTLVDTELLYVLVVQKKIMFLTSGDQIIWQIDQIFNLANLFYLYCYLKNCKTE